VSSSGDVPAFLFGQPVKFRRSEVLGGYAEPYREVTLSQFHVSTGGSIYLATSAAGDDSHGWGVFGGGHYELRPILDDHPPEGTPRSLLLLMKPEAERSRPSPRDFSSIAHSGDVQNQTNAAVHPQDVAERMSSNGSCEVDEVVQVSGPLTVIVGMTPQAYHAASTQKVAIPVQSKAAMWSLEQMLEHAGAPTKIQMTFSPGFVSYDEPLQAKSGDAHVLETMVKEFADGADPALVEFRKSREKSRADIGVLVVNQNSIDECGWARDIGADRDHAFVVVNWRCIMSSLTMPHEIGHILGARHSDDTDPPNYARAYIHDMSDKPFVTVMGYERNCANLCTRIDDFSNPRNQGPLAPGKHIGVKDQSDNACAVRRNIQRVVTFW